MSLIQHINKYEDQAKSTSLSILTSQFSGVLIVDYVGQMGGQIDYIVNDGAMSFIEPTYDDTGTNINVVRRAVRSWALPGYILSESIRNNNIAPAIQLPTLPFGFASSDPGDILLVTTIPKYWYPEVPNGDRLVNYELAFNRPFFEIKNNRQLFKVRQYNILEEGVIVVQLSSIPVTLRATINSSTTEELIF